MVPVDRAAVAGQDQCAVSAFVDQFVARQGERKEPPPELKVQMEQMDALNVGVPEFFDLKQPWLYSP